MFPHERSLVKRLENKPFALLGINTDQNRDKVRQDNQQQQITWRSWFDGQGGPICARLGVRSFPTILVLDAKGVIRYKNVREKALDNAVDALLKEIGSQ